eukprot:2879539-Pyramimonas_sp.AAC.1
MQVEGLPWEHRGGAARRRDDFDNAATSFSKSSRPMSKWSQACIGALGKDSRYCRRYSANAIGIAPRPPSAPAWAKCFAISARRGRKLSATL